VRCSLCLQLACNAENLVRWAVAASVAVTGGGRWGWGEKRGRGHSLLGRLLLHIAYSSSHFKSDFFILRDALCESQVGSIKVWQALGIIEGRACSPYRWHVFCLASFMEGGHVFHAYPPIGGGITRTLQHAERHGLVCELQLSLYREWTGATPETTGVYPDRTPRGRLWQPRSAPFIQLHRMH
jgi:hypothetical protein